MTATAAATTRASPLPRTAAAAVGFSSERLNRLDTAMQAEIDAGHYAGISVAVARHGKLVKTRCYGFQTLEGRAPLREDAIFRVASMTKPVIAAAMMSLYEQGRWQLDDPVTAFVPELAAMQVYVDGRLAPLERPMTMRHLMASSAGFASLGPLGSSNPAVDRMYADADLFSGTNEDMITKLAMLPLATQPGTQFRYGFQQEIQGVIIQRLSGQPLDTFLEDRLLGPLAMTDTGFDVAQTDRDRIPPRYTLDEHLRLQLAADQSAFPVLAGTAPGEKPHYLLSVAGLYSTTQDYLRFAQTLANGGALDDVRVLTPSSVALMTRNLLPAGVPMEFLQPFTGLGYGMGLGVVLDPAHADFTGGAIGAGSFYWGGVHGTWFWVDPIYEIVVVGMLQQENAGNGMTGRPYPVPDVRAITRSITYGALTEPER